MYCGPLAEENSGFIVYELNFCGSFNWTPDIFEIIGLHTLYVAILMNFVELMLHNAFYVMQRIKRKNIRYKEDESTHIGSK